MQVCCLCRRSICYFIMHDTDDACWFPFFVCIQRCTPGTFSPSEGQPSCIACASGLVSDSAAVVCRKESDPAPTPTAAAKPMLHVMFLFKLRLDGITETQFTADLFEYYKQAVADAGGDAIKKSDVSVLSVATGGTGVDVETRVTFKTESFDTSTETAMLELFRSESFLTAFTDSLNSAAGVTVPVSRSDVRALGLLMMYPVLHTLSLYDCMRNTI